MEFWFRIVHTMRTYGSESKMHELKRNKSEQMQWINTAQIKHGKFVCLPVFRFMVNLIGINNEILSRSLFLFLYENAINCTILSIPYPMIPMLLFLFHPMSNGKMQIFASNLPSNGMDWKKNEAEKEERNEWTELWMWMMFKNSSHNIIDPTHPSILQTR